MLWPVNAVLHVVVTWTIKSFHCFFINVVLLLLSQCKYLICNPCGVATHMLRTTALRNKSYENGTKEIVQLAEFLLKMHKTLGSIPRIIIIRPSGTYLWPQHERGRGKKISSSRLPSVTWSLKPSFCTWDPRYGNMKKNSFKAGEKAHSGRNIVYCRRCCLKQDGRWTLMSFHLHKLLRTGYSRAGSHQWGNPA